MCPGRTRITARRALACVALLFAGCSSGGDDKPSAAQKAQPPLQPKAVAKKNARLRKRHRRPKSVRLTVRSTFKARHGKRVTVTKGVAAKAAR